MFGYTLGQSREVELGHLEEKPEGRAVRIPELPLLTNKVVATC